MTTTGRSSAVEAYDLVKTYPKRVRALTGLSVRVQPGEIVGRSGRTAPGRPPS